MPKFGRWIPLGAALVAACSRESSRAPDEGVARTPAADPKPAPAAPAPFRHAAARRVVAIGDVHGDLAATRAALRLASAIDAQDRWTGGDLVLVQTGDQLDRGDDERAIVDLFDRLVVEAGAAGGKVIPLNGNHEVMNVQGDFRYVTAQGFLGFGGVSPESPHASRVGQTERQRAAAFLPGGEYARRLAKRDVVAVVGDTVFVHGGLLPEHVDYGVARLNDEVKAWMAGTSLPAPASIASPRAPIWIRDYSESTPTASACATLERALQALGAKRMVVGHTVQTGGINSGCGDKIFRIDVGLARYYGENPVEVLEITGTTTRILRGPRAAPVPAPSTPFPPAKEPRKRQSPPRVPAPPP